MFQFYFYKSVKILILAIHVFGVFFNDIFENIRALAFTSENLL